jgi:hypothetical protein
MDDYTEETYYFDTAKEASDAMDVMRAERACDIAYSSVRTSDGRYKVTVKVGEAR